MPQMPGIEEVPYLNNSSIMDIDFLPRHLVIIGGGYIGLEFAQMYRRFGSEVTIVERARTWLGTKMRMFRPPSGRSLSRKASTFG